MSVWELRGYYQMQYDEASRLMVAQPEGTLNHRSAEAAVTYFGTELAYYGMLCTQAELLEGSKV